jgi:ABC-type nitrate/sulfonate/bicarbonate transport system permease component
LTVIGRLRPVLALATTLALWHALALWAGSPLLVPPPAQVARAFGLLIAGGELAHHVAVSLQRLAVGLLVGVPLGTVLGCAMGRSWFLDALVDPYLRMANSTPAIALIPFSLLWFGVTEVARDALLVYIVALTLTLAARDGVRRVPAIQLKAASALGVTGVEALLRVVVPATFPAVLAGTRTAIGLGVMVIVAAEMLGATSGLGYLIMEGRAHYNVERMFVGMIGLGLLSLGLDRAFLLTVERAMPRWSVARRVR